MQALAVKLVKVDECAFDEYWLNRIVNESPGPT